MVRGNVHKVTDVFWPINGNFDDCTKDILRDLYESSDSDEDDRDDTNSVD